jgi:succinate dehydrogenase/fumarate reductase flavoprotein subunit
LGEDMITCTADVLVIGGGPAGCFAAVKAKEAGAERVLLVDKGRVGKSGCATFGAGSLKAFLPDEDDYDIWFGKAIEAGHHINDQEWTEIHLAEVGERVRDLESWGVEFERNEDGSYRRIEGQGSSSSRPIPTLMFHGPQLMERLRLAAKRMGVQIVDRTMITSLLHGQDDSNSISGAMGFEVESGRLMCFLAPATVLTTGGQAYKSPYAYQKMVTGDGHVMGLEAGATVGNYEFSTHHLSYAGFDTTGMNVLQGLGGRFLNGLGEPFMRRYDPEHGDYANLNYLSAGMALEVRVGRGPIFMDLTHFSPDDMALFARVLPIMYLAFQRAGLIVDGRVPRPLEWLSVNMGAIGFGGGLHIDTSCHTSLHGLFAAGDATDGPSAGVEGYTAYAIPFAMTSGARAGRAAAELALEARSPVSPDGAVPLLRANRDELARAKARLLALLERRVGVEPDFVVLRLQEILFPMDVYILRSEKRLREALSELEELKASAVPRLVAYDPHYLRMAVEASNMVRCGELFLRAALARTESRGSHRRLDYPYSDNDGWLRWQLFQESNGVLSLKTEPIPIGRYRSQPPSGRIPDTVLANAGLASIN